MEIEVLNSSTLLLLELWQIYHSISRLVDDDIIMDEKQHIESHILNCYASLFVAANDHNMNNMHSFVDLYPKMKFLVLPL